MNTMSLYPAKLKHSLPPVASTEGKSQYVESWYPLCRSTAVKIGQVISVAAFDTKLIVFRGHNHKVAVLKSHCCHMGTDLSNGTVIGNNLQCPLHHWQFDQSGCCAKIPCLDNPPADFIRQPSYTCMERYGVIFVYNGHNPAFTPPWLKDYQHHLFTYAYQRSFSTSYDVLGANAFDQQHLLPVHNRVPIKDQFAVSSQSAHHLRVDFKAEVMSLSLYDRFMKSVGFGTAHIIIDCWGGNNLLMTHPGTKNSVIFMTLPVRNNKTELFLITRSANTQYNTLLHPWAKLRLTLSARLIRYFLRNDFRVLEHMQFHTDNLLVGCDDGVKQWMHYWKNLPKNNIF